MDADSTRSMQVLDFMAWAHANRRRLAMALAALVALIALYFIWGWKKKEDVLKANQALFSVNSTQSVAKGAPASPEPYLKVANDYKGTPAGAQASLLAASALFAQNKYTESQTEFEKFLKDYSDSPLAPQAVFGVAASIEGQGKVNDAVTKYREISTRYANENIAPQAKLSLARILVQQNKPDQALKIYDDLTKNPDAWSGEARVHREELLKNHPNLVKTSAPVVVASTNSPTAVTIPTSTNILLKPSGTPTNK